MKDADAPRCLRQRLQKAGAGLEGGACCCQQQHRACQLECSEQRAGAHRRLGEVGDLGGIRPWHTHPQAHRQHGEAERQPPDHDEREPERDPAEHDLGGSIKLTQLSHRRGWRLDPGCECHRDWKREQHRQRRRPIVPRRSKRRPAAACGIDQPDHDHDRPDHHEADRHQRKQRAAMMAEQGQPRHSGQQHDCQRNPSRRQSGLKGDDRRRSRGDRDCDRQRIVDDQRTERQKRPPVAEGGSRRRSVPTPREPAQQAVIVADHQADDGHHDRHRRNQKREVTVKRPQRRLDRIRHRRHRIAHHRERKRDQQHLPRLQQRLPHRSGAGVERWPRERG